MIDPTLEITIDGKAVKISELVEMYRGLRWRRWPEEKPSYAEEILVIKRGSIHLASVSSLLEGRFWQTDGNENGDFSREIPLWLPLSALPKPEGEK